MSNFEDHFQATVDFIKNYQELIECHLVDFFTDNLWDKCLSTELKSYLEENSTNIAHDLERFNEVEINHSCSELSSFLSEIENLKLKKNGNIISRNQLLKLMENEKTGINEKVRMDKKFMSFKKCHEVEIFSKTVAWLQDNESSIIIDAGAGKGYAAFHLCDYYKLHVLAVESSQIKCNSAISRSQPCNRKDLYSESSVHYVVEEIDKSTDYAKMAKDNFPYVRGKLTISALHACGSLTDSVIKSFVNNDEIICLCLVPCCYHLATESLSSNFEFSKNSRMLAQQCTDKMRGKNQTLSPSLFYRAVLQVILQYAGISDQRIGRGAPTGDFVTYAKWALKRLNTTKSFAEDYLVGIHDKYKKMEWKFKVFQLLRISLAPVIEASIILDKFLFIQRSNCCSKLYIVQMFDPVLSPRSWAIVAKKK